MEAYSIYYSHKDLTPKMEMSTDNKCNVWNVDEDFMHYFLLCDYLKHFWEKVDELLRAVNYDTNISLLHLLCGYKIFDKNYND